jgi:hypothetical protein
MSQPFLYPLALILAPKVTKIKRPRIVYMIHPLRWRAFTQLEPALSRVQA